MTSRVISLADLARRAIPGSMTVEESRRVHPGPGRDRRVHPGQVGARAGVRPPQGPVGVQGQPHRCALPLRVRHTSGQSFRSYGNENWEFDERGYMQRREASINDVPIDESERRLFGPRAEGDTSGIQLQ